MFLTVADLQRITGVSRYSAQRRALDRLGIRYLRAATGEPLVRPEWLDGPGKQAQRGHRWDRIGRDHAAAAPLALAHK